MKALIPSQREKKRYLLITGINLRENVRRAILDYVGKLGFSKVALSFIQEDEKEAIICINRESLNLVRASLCIWPEKITVKKVSGTLKGLRD